MFEKAIFRKLQNAESIGALAEALLFYQHVHLILHPGTISLIAKTIGIESFEYLLKSGMITASFLPETFGISTDHTNGLKLHRPVQFIISKQQKGLLPIEDQIRTQLERNGFDADFSKRTARKFDRIIPRERLKLRTGSEINISALASRDFGNPDYVRAAAPLVIRNLVPEFVIPSNWDFRLEETADGFFAATNYRFDELTSRYRKRIPDGEITAAFILSNMMEARAEITFAAKHISELVTDPISSALLRQQFELTAEKAAESAQEISSFQDMILSGKTLAEAINSGERTFSEFLTLLDKARRFKEWLKGAHPEKGLLSEYYKATTSKTWIDTLAGKSIRFCLVTAGGAIAGLAGGVAAELGVGVADAFLTDKIAIGWKPNHFVENHLTTFVTPTL